MKKISKGAAFKQWLIIILFVAAGVLSALTMGKIAINYNLSDYLDESTQTKIALNLIEDEFGMTGTVQVMAKNVSEKQADEILDKIEAVDNVLNVNFDKYDESYYKNGNALYIVIVDGDDYSDNAKQVAADIKTALSSYEGTEYGGTAIEKQSLQNSITSEMTYILAIALCLVVAILLITSESWLEPFVLLLASGVAVLINRGTNIFFGEISYITNSISAILQLALSVDYSIVLLHAYRKEKENAADNASAMVSAVKSVAKPVSASALTTIAGLLALLFMSFRIGFDIGIVLMKGIVISAITSLTLLPALVLAVDKLVKKTKKKPFVPKGEAFAKVAFKASKVIVPLALAVVVACGFLQANNTFIFSDTSSGNAEITKTFGNNNSVVVVYKNSDKNNENEQKLAEALSKYTTKNGDKVLANYTAYTNTSLEEYDVKKATQKLEVDENDAEMLFTMYNLYSDPARVKMSFEEFVEFSNELIKTDEDAINFSDEQTKKTLQTLKAAHEITCGDFTAEELYDKITTGVFEGTDLKLFSVKQLYGMYFYDEVTEKNVDFLTMLDFTVSASENENVKDMFDENTVLQLKQLSAGVKQFEAQMETRMDKATFKVWFAQNFGVTLSDEQLAQIYAGYFMTTGEAQSETIPLLPLLKFLVASGQITDERAVATINGYDSLYGAINSSYPYERFLPALTTIATALSGETPSVSATNESIQQIYILYFYANDKMPAGKINGKVFAQFAIDTSEKNQVVKSQLSDGNRDKLADMITVSDYFADKTELDYVKAYEKLSELQGKIKSDIASAALSEEKVSGVFIKYSVIKKNGLTDKVRACDLVGFLSANKDENELLVKKIDDDKREKIADAEDDIQKAKDLFVGENYSRMLISVNLPNESKETTEFVEYLSAKVGEVFGEGSYVAGEIVSTYDLESAFAHDNAFITVFTLISIFVIVLLIFKSISLPVVLVAVIQGAIFVAMSTQLFSSGIFFMSYIVTTCILMGATIDYGILMSSNYVALRGVYDKKKSLELSLEAAMPTVFSSGLILTVCGFVIHFVSSQNSISTVGLLIGIGTICSVVMITLVLPSVLYLLDKFILALSLKKKEKKEEK